VELCTELFYAIIPTLFLCFAELLSLQETAAFYTEQCMTPSLFHNFEVL